LILISNFNNVLSVFFTICQTLKELNSCRFYNNDFNTSFSLKKLMVNRLFGCDNRNCGQKITLKRQTAALFSTNAQKRGKKDLRLS
jgi:hypothetical protein